MATRQRLPSAETKSASADNTTLSTSGVLPRVIGTRDLPLAVGSWNGVQGHWTPALADGPNPDQ